MGYKKAQNNEPTTDVFIRTVGDRVNCPHHDKGHGKPCWWLRKDDGGLLAGVCNKRAISAGFVGLISPGALNKVEGGKPRFNKPSKKK